MTRSLFAQILCGVVAALTAVPAVGEPARYPVNCATAEGDLRAFAAERKHAQAQQAESILGIRPTGALLGLVAGTEQKRLKMLSGAYRVCRATGRPCRRVQGNTWPEMSAG